MEKLSSNSLMLGDWVLCDGKPYRINQIGDILCMDNEEKSWLAHPEDVSPIPLTPEILEKNGFKKYGDTGWWLEDDYYDVQIYEWSDSIWVARYESNEMNCPHEQLTMSYIHELQHFLKAVGIEKEIII